MNAETTRRDPAAQLPLFGAMAVPSEPDNSRAQVVAAPTMVSPYLLAARRLSKRIRRLRDHSPEETQTGLAICQALKAYLRDQTDQPH